MLQRLEIRAIHVNIDDNLRKYVTKKIGKLDKYLSRHNRESAHAEVQLKETNARDSKCMCDVTLHLPHETINVRESTLNMYAAIDIVEAKLKQQNQRHKDSRTNGKIQRHLWGRFSRHTA